MTKTINGIKINHKKPTTTGRKVFLAVNAVFMVLISLTFILPYINILAKAFNVASDTMLGGLAFWPRKWTLDNFAVVFRNSQLWVGLKNSVIRVVAGSLFSLAIEYMTAYALIKKRLRFKKAIIMFFTIPMFISGGLIAQYIYYPIFGIYNTFWVYILPSSFSFYNMVIIRTYMQGIPVSLIESSRLDGASELTILWKIMVPLSTPILATIFLWHAVGAWNDWTTTLYFVEDPSLYTLQYILQLSIKETQSIQQMIANALESGKPLGNISMDITAESIQAAQLIVTTLPILCVYPFLQKYFMSGVMIGSVKG